MVVSLAMLLSTPAFACDPPQALEVLAVSPEPGSESVPTDARVVLQVRGRDVLPSVGVALFDEDGQVEGEWDIEWTQGELGLYTFTPSAPLRSNATHNLRLEVHHDDVYTEPWSAGFRTGFAATNGLMGRPTLELVDVGQAMEGVESRCEPEGFRRVQVRVEPATVERPSEEWMHLYLEEGQELKLVDVRRLDAREWSQAHELVVPTADRSFCLVAVHHSAAGVPEVGDPACWEREPIPEDQQIAYYGGGSCSGCAAGPASWIDLWPGWSRRR